MFFHRMLEDITFRALRRATHKYEQVLIDANIEHNSNRPGVLESIYNVKYLDNCNNEVFQSHIDVMRNVLEFCRMPRVACIPEVYREISRHEDLLSRSKMFFENHPVRVKSNETLSYFKEYVSLVREWTRVLKERRLIMTGEVYTSFVELEKHLRVLCRRKTKPSGRHKPAEQADPYLVAAAFCSEFSTCIATNDSDVIRLLRGTYHMIKAIEHNENEQYLTKSIAVCCYKDRGRYEEVMNTDHPQTMGNAAALADRIGGFHHFKRLVFSAYSILRDALHLPRMINVPRLKEFVYSTPSRASL